MSSREVVLHDLGGAGPVLLFMHANGFHGRAYLPIARQLPQFRCIGMDFNGHGDAPLRLQRLNPVDIAHAAAAAIRERGLQGCFCFGHSMGGLIAPLLESLYPGTFSALVLFDPTATAVHDQQEYHKHSTAVGQQLEALVTKRRRHFDSLQAARASLSSKPPFSAFHPDVLQAYLEFGMQGGRDDGQPGVQLKCSPSTEAAVFRAWFRPPGVDVSRVACPVLVLTAQPDEGPHRFLPPQGRRTAQRLPRGWHMELAPLSHFGPMEDPGRIARLIAQFLPAVLQGAPGAPLDAPTLRSKL